MDFYIFHRSIHKCMHVFSNAWLIHALSTVCMFHFMCLHAATGLHLFAEYAYPNRSFSNRKPSIFNSHALASNLGLRKYGAFAIKELIFGLEYTRLVQGMYYNILPTPNWYDNIC